MQTQIIAGSVTLNPGDLFESTYTHTVNSGQQLNIGAVASAQVTFKTEHQFSVGTSFRYLVRPRTTGSFTQLGVFTIKSVDIKVSESIGKRWYIYTAYDNVSKLDRVVDSWYSGRSYPVNLQSLFTTLCSACGVTGNGSFDANAAVINVKPFDVTNLNGKTVAGWIAQIAGGYVYADSAGTLRIKHYNTSSSASFTFNDYSKKDISNFVVQKPTLIRVVKNTKGEFRDFGSGSPMLKISGNPLAYETQGTLAYIGNILGWLPTYTPMSIHLFDNLAVSCGDRITVDGVATIVMTKKIDKSGITLSSTGVETRQEETELQNDFVSYDYLVQNKITVDTTTYGFVVDNGSERTRLTPTQLIHEGIGNKSAAVQGDGFKWFDNSGYLTWAIGQYNGKVGIQGIDHNGNIVSFLAPAATDQWYQLQDGTTKKWGSASQSASAFTPSNPPSNLWSAVKWFVVELTTSQGGDVYASTVVPAWPKGSTSVEEITGATQTVHVRYNTVEGYCDINYQNWTFHCWTNNSGFFVRVKCIF